MAGEDWEFFGQTKLAKIYWALRAGLMEIDPSSQTLEDGADRSEAPRWASTLSYVDIHCGGFYGVSTLAGRGGVGKSMLAFASAIEAAASLEWQVVYLQAEMDSAELARRGDAYLAAHPAASDAVERLTMIHLPRGGTLMRLAETICAACDHEDSPLLVVLDSINTAAELLEKPYLIALRDLALWAMMSRRLSRGAVSWLIVSELNKAGGVRGDKLTYWSDLVLTMKRPSARAAPNIVELELAKSRSTGGEGSMGKYVRRWQSFDFLPERELERPVLKVVGARGPLFGDDV